MPIPKWFSRLIQLSGLQRIAQQKEKAAKNQSVKLRSKRVKATTNESRIANMSPEQRLLAGAMEKETLREYTRGMYSIDADLTTMFTSAIQDRRDYLETSSELRRYPVAARILKIISSEVLKPNDRGEILELVSEHEDVDQELKKFQEQHNLDNLLRMILQDVLNLGEYSLAITVEDGEGITAIEDTVDQLAIVAFYERGVPSSYLVWKHDNYWIEPPNKYCHFVIGEEKMRVALNDSLHRGYQIDFDKIPEELRNKIPEFIRVGEPLFFSVVEKIRQLQILEQIVIATKLSAVTQTKLIGLKVPAAMPVDKVMEACQKFEETLNTQTGLDQGAEMITVSEIMGKAGRFTVIPQYADEKGSMEPLDIRHDPQVDDLLNSIEDFRQVLLSCVGVPYKLVFGPRGNETVGSRGDDVRLHAMFSNMISSIQASIRNGVTQLCLMHLLNKGYKVKAQDFEVIFKNASVNVGDLEKLEFDDAKQDLVGRKIDFIDKMEQNPILGPNLNRDGIYEWLEESFSELTNGIPMFKQHVDDSTIPAGDMIQGAPVPLDPSSRSLSRSDLKRKIHYLRKVTDIFKANREKRELNQNDPEGILDPEAPVDENPKLQMTKDGTFEPPTSPIDAFGDQNSDYWSKKQNVDKVVDTFKKKLQSRIEQSQQGKQSLSEVDDQKIGDNGAITEGE